MPEVRATVRLQFHRGFTLNDAIPLVPYFNKLGISHIYSSPVLKARSGSVHGYDVVDPTCINPEIGGESALVSLVAELRKYDMGLIVDIVSNHMAVSNDNPWWQDVLCWGLHSPYANFFDIQWNSPDPLLKGQLLLPVLGSGYGETLAANEISLQFNQAEGKFYAQYFDNLFPLTPTSYGHILGKTNIDSLRLLGQAFDDLENRENAWEVAKELQADLRDLAEKAEVIPAITQAISFYNVALGKESALRDMQRQTANDDLDVIEEPDPQDNDNFQRLHQLLELQHYRLASWRTAADDINWRRFFDVNELAGLRVERPDVFEASHRKIFELIEQGLIDGIRIDHIDGLANPRAYCRKLRRRVDRLAALRPRELAQKHFPIYVEKILGEGEHLATQWMVDGTTGYEFMNQVSLLQHDPLGELQLFDLWSTTTGRMGTFKDEAREARRLVLASSLAGDLETVAQGLLLIARTDITTRDLTLGAIRRALTELIVNFTVYRTYAGACGRTGDDEHFFKEALAGARLTLAEADWPLLDQLDRWLGGEALAKLPPGETRNLRQTVLTRFQQLTSPAAAKAIEDTACYRSAVLLSRNDVGFNPHCFSASITQFHEQIAERNTRFPRNLLATATHDHKRGEDTRARLAVISERSAWFAERAQRWRSMSAPLRKELEDGTAPSAGDELILYQTLLGCWPLEFTADAKPDVQVYLDRLMCWQEKSVREAKLRSTWSAPNAAYERATQEFLMRLLNSEEGAPIRAEIAHAAQLIAPAGALNSLSQTLLRMTVPGIPDLYQGADFWDFSLVDPDNRRPVDFGARIAALETKATAHELIEHWQDGHIKQWLIARTLAARARHSELFRDGDYQPLTIEGEQADKVVAFMRRYLNDYAVVIVPRLTASLLADSTVPHIPVTAWGDTQILLPAALKDADFEGQLDASRIKAKANALTLRDALATTPVNFLFFSVTHSQELHHEHK
ncbi:malto-oligosyltrehalose synthase [Cellvibrio zantedeschiae]|uniref:Malto-oligosyltrehalose synthase n=1 Tax=Cellvibrio zantedeschiae TaxID=1237077 RepID=A0ABQ3AZ92_9GAMM|nr:malto-oligosyltrehalose synthase [Cellvibrio zantedeschiae]GGY71871.1 malto-oligosyltrehalose synthase [Cellvibrio zantedeschiae]